MEDLISLLIQRAYHYYKETHYQQVKKAISFSQQEKLVNIFSASTLNSFVFFAGWETNHEKFGSTLSCRLTHFNAIVIYKHNIRLNRYFLLSYMGYRLPNDHSLNNQFTVAKLAETIAEEVAHCLARELYSKEIQEHGFEHAKIKESIEEYLQNEPILQLMAREEE